MRITTTQIALLALPALIHAQGDKHVALIDFVPRLNDVSGDCNKIYQQQITGCSSSDFTKQGCSVSCVKGLEALTQSVKDACGNKGLLDGDDVDSNVLAMFLQNRGPQSLCTNANEVLQSDSSSSAAPETSAKPSPTPSPSPTGYPTTSDESTTSIASSTATASLTDVPTSLVMDTSSSPESTTSDPSSEATKSSVITSTSTGSQSSQIFEAPSMPTTFASTATSSHAAESSGHSGGGSPFDAEGNQFSAGTATTSSAMMLLLAVAFAGIAAQW